MPKYIAAFLTMVLLLGGTAQVASAESDISQGQVQEILKEYNDSLQSAYFASNSRSSQNVPMYCIQSQCSSDSIDLTVELR